MSANSIDPLLSSGTVRKVCGGVSSVTLSRWIRVHHDDEFKLQHPKIAALKFPPPDKVMAGNNYWKQSTIQHFIEQQDAIPEQVA